MAANYWSSTQRRHWLFTPTKLASMRSSLDSAQGHALIAQYPLPDYRLVLIYLRDQLHKLSRRLPTRQPILATTLLYLSRYWLLRPMRLTNPYLLLATSFYLASKTEELPHHIRLVLTEAKNLWPEFIPSDPARLGECEFGLISELNSQLIVFHPYRTVVDLSGRGDQQNGPGSGSGGSNGNGSGASTNDRGGNSGLGMGISASSAFNPSHNSHSDPYRPNQTQSSTQSRPNEANGSPKNFNLNLSAEETSMAWSIVNDSYLTDLPLTCPPHIIAIMAIFLAVVFLPSRSTGLNLHSINAQQQQQQQTQGPGQVGFNGGAGAGGNLSGTGGGGAAGAASTHHQTMHALPPKPGSYAQHFSSLGGSRGLSAALRDSTSTSTSNLSSTTATTTTTPHQQQPSSTQTKAQSDRIEKLVTFLAESEIEIEKVIDATQEIISLYEVWEGYSEKNVKEAIGRYVRGRGLDK